MTIKNFTGKLNCKVVATNYTNRTNVVFRVHALNSLQGNKKPGIINTGLIKYFMLLLVAFFKVAVITATIAVIPSATATVATATTVTAAVVTLLAVVFTVVVTS